MALTRHYDKKSLKNYRRLNREIAAEGKKYGKTMTEIPEEEWPSSTVAHNKGTVGSRLLRVWRSRDFIAQLYQEASGNIRLSINRTVLTEKYDYADNISWDDLFRIKNECGFSDHDMIELYPAKKDLVNVANIRHLFLLDKPSEFNWYNKTDVSTTYRDITSKIVMGG